MSNPQLDSNTAPEISTYQQRIIQLESTLIQHKSQIQKMELTNKRLHEIISKHGLNINNTSVGFFLPSEFKNLWEKLIKTELPDALDSYIDDPVLLANLSQDIFVITYNQTSDMINSKVNLILKSLNIKATTVEERRQILTKFIPFFQEHFSEILHLDNETIELIKHKITVVTREYDFIWKKENLHIEMNKQEFNSMLNTFFCIASYMLLHEPELTVDVVPFKERKIMYMFYNKKYADIIDGFANEEIPCIVILQPPLLRGQYAFKGMKPAVCALNELHVNDNVIEECEKNKKMFNNNNNNTPCKSTNNTPILNKITIDTVEMIETWKSSQKPQSNVFRVMNGLSKGNNSNDNSNSNSSNNKKIEAKRLLAQTLPKGKEKKLELELPEEDDNEDDNDNNVNDVSGSNVNNDNGDVGKKESAYMMNTPTMLKKRNTIPIGRDSRPGKGSNNNTGRQQHHQQQLQQQQQHQPSVSVSVSATSTIQTPQNNSTSCQYKLSNHYDFKINSERNSSRKKFTMPKPIASTIPMQQQQQPQHHVVVPNSNSFSLYLNNSNNNHSATSFTKQQQQPHPSFNNPQKPNVTYQIPNFNVIRNKDMSRVSKSKEQQQQNPHNTSSALPTKIEPSNMNYQMFRRESYTPYIASKTRQQTREAETPKNSVKHPITPSKQMSMSYRYSQQQSEQSSIEGANNNNNESGNINNNININTNTVNNSNNHKQLYGRSGYYQSNNFMVNEMKVNELKKKYHMEDIENGMDVESPKYAMISFNNNNTSNSHLNGNTINNNTNSQGYNYYQSERFNYNSIKHYKPTPYYQYME